MGLKYRPKSEYKLNKLADLYLKMGEKVEAKKVYDKILKLYPENQNATEMLKKFV
jgi:TolA-binding protein